MSRSYFFTLYTARFINSIIDAGAYPVHPCKVHRFAIVEQIQNCFQRLVLKFLLSYSTPQKTLFTRVGRISMDDTIL